MDTNIGRIEFVFKSAISVIVVVGIQSYEYRYDRVKPHSHLIRVICLIFPLLLSPPRTIRTTKNNTIEQKVVIQKAFKDRGQVLLVYSIIMKRQYDPESPQAGPHR